jgi:hypothetical protein
MILNDLFTQSSIYTICQIVYIVRQKNRIDPICAFQVARHLKVSYSTNSLCICWTVCIDLKIRPRLEGLKIGPAGPTVSIHKIKHNLKIF